MRGRRPVDAVPVRLAAHARASAAALDDGDNIGSDALHTRHAIKKRRRLESHPTGSGNTSQLKNYQGRSIKN